MQLVFPGFLWCLSAVSVPVLLHLLQLRRPQRIQFTNTGFIQEIEFKSGRRRLQDLLILLLRVLAVIFLVLAFCQPFIPAKLSRLGVTGQEAKVLIDNSLSMRVPGREQGSLLENSLDAVGQLRKNYGAGSRLQLVGTQRVGGRVSDFATDLGSFSQQRRQRGWGGSEGRRELESKSGGLLYVFSDFQRSESSAEFLRQIPLEREVVLVPQVGRAVGNVYVDSIWLNDAFVRVRANMGLHIRLRNGGQEAISDCLVKVLLAGRQVATFQVAVAPGQALERVVQVQLPDKQLAQGQVVVTDGPVAFDNTYYFTLRPTAAVRVVEIGPKPIAQAAYQREPLFQYSYSKAQQIDFGRLQQANLVLVSEATVLDGGLREALGAVVKRGGSVVVVPPAAPAAHELYGQLLRYLGVGGVQWEQSSGGEPVRQELAMPNLRSPFFGDVFGAQSQQVALPEASPVLRLGGAGTDILRLRDGSPFLTEFAAGAGKVYVFSAPFDRKYSDFITQSLFVPVLYRLAMLSYAADQPLAYRVGQAALRLELPAGGTAGRDEAAYRLVRDSLTLVPAQRQQGQQLRLEVPAELTTPGFYQLQRQGRVVGTLAFNGAKKESELAAYSAAELRQLVGPDRPNVRVLDEGSPAQALLRYRAEQAGQPLWRYCLLLALGCLLVEGVVLRWGRRAGVPVAVAS